MIDPMIDWALAVNPPIPMPWIARIAMSSGTFCEIPASTEPITKITIDNCTRSFLLTRSESLPQTGVDTVMASRDAVTTQVYWVCEPWRSAMIVGKAFDTIVELMIAVKSAASRPKRTSRISRWVSSAGWWAVGDFTSSCTLQL